MRFLFAIGGFNLQHLNGRARCVITVESMRPVIVFKSVPDTQGTHFESVRQWAFQYKGASCQ